jgi:hypothetical protein
MIIVFRNSYIWFAIKLLKTLFPIKRRGILENYLKITEKYMVEKFEKISIQINYKIILKIFDQVLILYKTVQELF